MSEKPTVVNGQSKLTKDQWECVKALFCAGESAGEIAPRYGIAAATIHSRASRQKWPTPARIAKASTETINTDDPASAIADLWARRKTDLRENVYQGASKALQRFFAMSPVPASFQEATLAHKLAQESITPEEDKTNQGNVNIAFISGGFKPRPVVEV